MSASELASIKPQLDELGIKLVAVGSGSPFMATAFKEKTSFPGELFVDQKRVLYQALDCKRGLTRVLGLKSLAKYKNAMSKGFSQGKTQGNGLQLGGTFLMSKAEGIVFQHLEEFAGDHVNYEVLLKACSEQVRGAPS